MIRGTVQYHTFALKSCLLWGFFCFTHPSTGIPFFSAPVIYIIIQFLFKNLPYPHKYCTVTRELSKTTAEHEPRVDVSGNRPPGSCDT